MTQENEIRRQTIDALYQSILAQKIHFPADIREVFHQAMNALAEPPHPGKGRKVLPGDTSTLVRSYPGRKSPMGVLPANACEKIH